MATARAQAASGLGVRVRQIRSDHRVGGDDPHTEQSRHYTAEDEESHVEWMKRIMKRALWTPYNFWAVASLWLAVDTIATMVIVLAIKYTEIDFVAYVQQAQIFLKGERRYDRLIGDTGPCVYPALHVYISSALNFVSSGGHEVRQVQLIFVALYLVTQVLVMAIYKSARIPPIILPLLVMSKRLHSIYVLRLFNDCWALAFMYASILAICKGRWTLASTLFSLALGVKMNIILYAPALCAIYIRSLGIYNSIFQGILVVLLQVLFGLPFILHNALIYFTSAFDLSRAFLFRWTVNWRFVGQEIFLDNRFAQSLLVAHATVLLLWIMKRWTGVASRGCNWIQEMSRADPQVGMQSQRRIPSGKFVATALFTSNLIGIIFARSLHYQFYSWYAHQIPLLVYTARLPRVLKMMLPVLIESAWNTYPSTDLSSQILLVSHLVLLLGLWGSHADDTIEDEKREDDKVTAAALIEQYNPPYRASQT